MYAGWDLVIWALLLVGIVLWNVLQGILRKRRRLGRQVPDAGTEAQPVPGPWETPAAPEPWGREPLVPVVTVVPREVAEHAAREAARAARERPAPRPGRPRVTRWRSRAEVRRAFVDVAVLGPPRALEPWDGGYKAASRGAADQ